MVGFVREHVSKRSRRSKGWRKVRNAEVKRAGKCECCGRKWNLQVHHIEDFSTAPERELDPENLLVLCGRCHLLVGHLNYWRSINPTVVTDAMLWDVKIRHRRTA